LGIGDAGLVACLVVAVNSGVAVGIGGLFQLVQGVVVTAAGWTGIPCGIGERFG